MEALRTGQYRTSGATALVAPVSRNTPAAGVLRGQKMPYTHRIFLTDGRVIQGDLHRLPNTRLGDHLAMQKGYLSVTNAVCERTNQTFDYLVVVLSNVLFLEEVDGPGPEGLSE